MDFKIVIQYNFPSFFNAPMQATCPCGSSNTYAACCELFHANPSLIQTAEQLMRARYVGFVLQKTDFLYQTFHPQTRRFQNKQAIAQWSKENTWQGLEIVKSTAQTVEFKAHYLDKQQEPRVHHEKSIFKMVQKHWFYLNGTILD
ncbi:YchJ family protein [Sphingobacterium sp. HJSM2_6]|uniref:YchJ family protein n=1 Tax=Sphingobacterium sp. HJSM2_6 TaxID=3366264 RepID=UPI003BEA71DB